MATVARILSNFKIWADGTIMSCFIYKCSEVPIQKAQIKQARNSVTCSSLSLLSPVPIASIRPFPLVSPANSVSPISSVSLAPSISPMSIRLSSIRSFHTSPSHGAENQDKKVDRKRTTFTGFIENPVNPLQWLRVWADFKYLSNTWDANIDIDRNDFVEGAKMAVCTITQLISQNSYSKLRGLLSKTEYKRLQSELEKSWSDVKRSNVDLDVEEIQNVVVTRLKKQQIVDQKFCDIDVYFHCLKEVGEGGEPIPIKIFARFHRDYTQGRLPNWIVTSFILLVY